LSSSLLLTHESFILLCFILIEILILVYFVMFVGHGLTTTLKGMGGKG
jgi:UPF0716 family protein affecting phage T7 exclusion